MPSSSPDADDIMCLVVFVSSALAVLSSVVPASVDARLPLLLSAFSSRACELLLFVNTER